MVTVPCSGSSAVMCGACRGARSAWSRGVVSVAEESSEGSVGTVLCLGCCPFSCSERWVGLPRVALCRLSVAGSVFHAAGFC